jgi:hypothetical protein
VSRCESTWVSDNIPNERENALFIELLSKIRALEPNAGTDSLKFRVLLEFDESQLAG